MNVSSANVLSDGAMSIRIAFGCIALALANSGCGSPDRELAANEPPPPPKGCGVISITIQGPAVVVVGDTARFKAQLGAGRCAPETDVAFRWNVGDTSIAIVNMDSGIVVGRRKGTTSVRAFASLMGFAAVTLLTVQEPWTNIAFAESACSLGGGDRCIPSYREPRSRRYRPPP